MIPVFVGAQQAAQYSLYTFNTLQYNPAYAGLDNSLSITGGLRRQWVGLEGSPFSQYINAHLPLYYLRGGAGISFENDALGAEQFTSVLLSYNYQIETGSGVWALGVGGGWVQRTLDGQKLRTPDGQYTEPGVIDHEDDLLPLGIETASVTTFTAGLYYQSERIEGGIGVRHLTEPKTPLGQLQLPLSRTYFLNLGFHFDLNGSFTIHPSLMVQSDFAQTQAQAGVMVKYNDNIFGGAAFRGYSNKTIDAAILMAGFKLSEKITLAYAYDLTLSGLSSVSNGSHEIVLNYNLGKRIGAGRPPRIIYNPRSL